MSTLLALAGHGRPPDAELRRPLQEHELRAAGARLAAARQAPQTHCTARNDEDLQLDDVRLVAPAPTTPLTLK